MTPRSRRPGALRARRVAAVVAATSALLVAAGCGSDSDSGSDAAPVAATATPIATPSVASAPDSVPSGAASTESTDGTGTDSTVLGSDGSGSDALGIVPGDAATPDAALVSAREDVFDVRSPWNTAVTDAPVMSGSARMLAAANIRVTNDINGRPIQNRAPEGFYINTRAWTVPVVAGGVPTELKCRQIKCGDGSGGLTLNVPESVNPDPLYDGWFTIFDQTTDTAYDLWRARREDDGTISYQYLRTWDLDGPGFARPYQVGARGSGLPLFAGLIRPGELERGQINHALAISLPGPAKGYFVQPASSTDGNGSANSVPEGARIRLRSDFVLRAPTFTNNPNRRLPFRAAQQRYADAIVRALKTYGAIVVDRAAVPTLYFQRIGDDRRSNVRNPLGSALRFNRYDPSALLQGYELQSLRLSDFSVVGGQQTSFAFPPRDQDTSASDLAAAVGSSGSGTDSTGGQ